MKKSIIALIPLVLLSSLLLTGCEVSDQEYSSSSQVTTTVTTPITTTVTTSTTTPSGTTDPVTDPPDILYRPDLIWEETYGFSHIMDDYIPEAGVIDIRFEMPDEHLQLINVPLDAKYAVHFMIYSSDTDWEALTAYLADLGIEEVGEAGGYKIPVYAISMDQLKSLDCATIQEAAGASTEYGIDVHLTSCNPEDWC